LCSYFVGDEDGDLLEAFDPRAGDWPQTVKEGLTELAIECLLSGRQYKNRIEVLPALRKLRDLDARHCQITAPEAQLEALRLRLAEIYARDDIDEHKQASQLRTCSVCYDDVQSRTGLQCPEPLHARNDDHFVCASCADRYVCMEIANNKEHTLCIEADCTARYTDTALARVLP
jgi:hypothetical protein